MKANFLDYNLIRSSPGLSVNKLFNYITFLNNSGLWLVISHYFLCTMGMFTLNYHTTWSVGERPPLLPMFSFPKKILESQEEHRIRWRWVDFLMGGRTWSSMEPKCCSSWLLSPLSSSRTSCNSYLCT